jgi:cysteine desulfurase
MIYLDYNATTPMCDQARAAMLPYLDRHFGNPSSVHAAGREARAAIDDARDKLAAFLRTTPHELIFTSGGTESCNLAVLGLARCRSSRGGHVISCRTEHHAVLNALEHLEKREGFEVTWLNVSRDGMVDLNQLVESIRDNTALVSIMAANNETGVIQPIGKISEICRARGTLLHSDMVQSFGKIDIDISLVDAASFGAHKFYGPKGAGLLFLRSGWSIQPIMFGGAHENERRPGTENVAAIAGMAGPIVETNRAKFSRRAAKWRGDSLFGEHAQRELSRFRFGDDADGARFGRRLRVERIGLHGRLGGSVARLTGDGSIDGMRKFGRSFFVRQTDKYRRNRPCRGRD